MESGLIFLVTNNSDPPDGNDKPARINSHSIYIIVHSDALASLPIVNFTASFGSFLSVPEFFNPQDASINGNSNNTNEVVHSIRKSAWVVFPQLTVAPCVAVYVERDRGSCYTTRAE